MEAWMHGNDNDKVKCANAQSSLKCAVDFAALDSAYLDFADRNIFTESFHNYSCKNHTVTVDGMALFGITKTSKYKILNAYFHLNGIGVFYF
jgi:hypothetical protein